MQLETQTNRLRDRDVKADVVSWIRLARILYRPHDKESSGSMKGLEIQDYLCDYQLHKGSSMKGVMLRSTQPANRLTNSQIFA
jgi:hypothetical protein